MTQRISFEQYGEIPERMKVSHEAEKLEANIKHFTDKNPKDKYAFAKGILSTNKWKFSKFVLIRTMLCCGEVFNPLLMVSFLDWVQNTAPDTYYSTGCAIMTALLIPLICITQRTVWENAVFEMIEVGHLSHTSLKSIISQKNMRMSAATNKDFSEGEITSLMFGDTNRVWDFVWQIPEFIEAPLILLVSLYYTFYYVGWYGFIVLAVSCLQLAMGYVREKLNKDKDKEQHEKNKERMLYINESFQNIKGIKLYGWENKLLDRIENVYQEEVALEDQTILRNRIYDFVNGCFTVFVPVILYGVYTYNGNTLNLSAMAMANLMMGRINGRMN